jgi:hypothetical protein
VPARPIASAFNQVIVHPHAGFAQPSFRAAITRNPLTSAGILVSIFMISGLYTGDFNPIWTVPMLGTHKPRLDNRWGTLLASLLSYSNILPALDAQCRPSGTSA